MRGGVARLATTPMMSSTLTGASVPAFIDLIANQELPRSYLFEAEPWDPILIGTTTVRASIGLPHSVLDSNYWPANWKSAVDSNIDLYGDDEDQQGRASFGNINLLLGDGSSDHDALITYLWDGRAVDIKLGGPDFDIGDYRSVVTGTAESITYTEQSLGVVFRGKEYLLDADIQSNNYAGTGGLEGDESLQGVRKPLVYGQVWGMSPVPVDPASLIYQYHDGEANAVLNAWDGGLELDRQGDVADITTATVGPGRYVTQLSGGYIRLGAPPAKQLTLDVQGDASGDGYQDNPADIIKRILLDKVGFADTDLNLPSFYDVKLDSERASAGILITNERAVSVVNDLIQSVGGAWSFNRLGKLTVNVLRLRRPSGTITENDIVDGSFFRSRTPSASYKRRVGYQRMWTVLSEDQLLESVTETRKSLMTTEYRYAEFSDTSIKIIRAGARDRERTTLLSNKTDADKMVSRQQAIFGVSATVPRSTDRFDVKLKRSQFKYQIGETITLEYDRFNISVNAVILGIRENTSTRQTALRLLAIYPSSEPIAGSTWQNESSGNWLKESGGSWEKENQ